jgi:hypothetical protein
MNWFTAGWVWLLWFALVEAMMVMAAVAVFKKKTYSSSQLYLSQVLWLPHHYVY